MEAELPEVVETQYIERFAFDGHLAHPCFCLRGLIPMDFYDITPPCDDLITRGFGVLATNALYLQEAGNSISEDRPGRLTIGQIVLERLIERFRPRCRCKDQVC